MDDEKIKVPAYLTIGKVIAYAMYIWVIFGIIVLGLRVFLLATSANPSTPFVNFIYNTSATYLQPFREIFPPKDVGSTGYIDVAAVFAMIIYAFIGWAFSALIDYIQSKIDKFKADTKAKRQQLEAQRRAAYMSTQKKSAPKTPAKTI
jgi:uncharacterized protein YggT (Ycf19 family)